MRLLLSLPQVVLLILTALLFQPPRASAAEQVVVHYRILHQSMSVQELSVFAETGQLSQALQRNFSLSKQETQVIRLFLTQSVNVNAALLERILDSLIGSVILDQLGKAIYPFSKQGDRQSLRTALVVSASKDNNVSLIELVRNYPTPKVQVDGNSLGEVYQQILPFAERL